MEKLNLVIGGNGHLGNNVVRFLLKKGEKVRTSVRNIDYEEPFQGLECEIVYADILNKKSLLKAMKDAHTVYIAAAAYKSWAKDIQKEIIDVNIEGTKNIMETAAKAGIKKIIYVSTAFTLDHTSGNVVANNYTNEHSDPYVKSKTEAERLAWELARKNDLWMVSVLPTGMIGPNSYGHLTPTMELFNNILKNEMPIDPSFNFNFLDIRDVAEMMFIVSRKGMKGERYLLAQNKPFSTTEIFEIAHSINCEVKIPKKRHYTMMYLMASAMEGLSKITKRRPSMLRSSLKKFYRANYNYNTALAKENLGFKPKPQREAVKDALEYIANKY